MSKLLPTGRIDAESGVKLLPTGRLIPVLALKNLPTGRSTPQVPSITGLLLALSAASQSTADISGQGNVVTEVGGAPTFGNSARFANYFTMDFTTGKCLTTTGPCQAYRTGADKAWTQVLIWRPRTVAATQQLMGWSNTSLGGATDILHLTMAQTGAPRRYQNVLRDNVLAATTVDSTELWVASPDVLIIRCAGTTLEFFVNGQRLPNSALTQNRGTLTADFYNFFCRNAISGLDASGNGDVAKHYVYDHAISDAEVAQWGQFGFDAYGIPSLNVVGPTGQKVGIAMGQSNLRLAGTTTLENPAKVNAFTLDYFWRGQPHFSQTDQEPVSNGVFNEGLGASINWGLFSCDYLGGATGANYGLVTTAKGSTGTGGTGPASATNWYPSTDIDTLYGAAMMTVSRGTLINGATPAYVLIDIGEEDSKTNPSTWGAGFAAIKTDLRSRFPGIPIIVRRLRATNPNPGLYIGWASTRADELAAHNPADGVWVIDSSDDPADYIVDGVHMTAAYQAVFGRTVIGPLLQAII